MVRYHAAAHLVRFVSHHAGGKYRFVHPRFDVTIEAGSLEELNAILIELGYCPVQETSTCPLSFGNATVELV